MPQQTTQQIPGVYHRRIGDIVVTAISDGYLDGTVDVMRNVDHEKARQLLKEAFRPARRTSVNTFLIHSEGRTAIVDTRFIRRPGSTAWMRPDHTRSCVFRMVRATISTVHGVVFAIFAVGPVVDRP